MRLNVLGWTGMRWCLLAVFAAHAALGAALGLSVDEAHYALYAVHPALSYFDHPPMVGWIQWPLVALHAAAPLLRLIPGVLWLATMVLVYRLTVRLAQDQPNPEGAGCWAVLSLLLAPLLHVLGIGLLPDTLLMLWSVAILWQTLQLMDGGTAARPGPWLLLGVLLGLAGLSKYTAIFTALAVAVCLLRVHGLALLLRPWPWMALVLAVLLVSPVLIWNAQNHWISFVYQAGHGAGSGWSAWVSCRYLLLQVFAYGPLLLWGGDGVVRVRPAWRWGSAFFVIPFAVLALLAGGGSSLPHWTAPAWVALAPFAGIGLAHSAANARRGRLWLLGSLQLLACLVVPLLSLSAGMPFLAGRVASAASSDPPNPFADVHGWDDAGARALELAQKNGLDAVAVQNWTLASRIGWYARPLKVFVLEDRFDQFDLWAGKLPVGGNALLVDWSQLPYQTPVSAEPGRYGFARCDALDQLVVRRWGFAVSHFDFFACSSWTGRAQPMLKP